MLFTLLASLILTQVFGSPIANFERQVALQQALQSGVPVEAQGPVRINPENLGPKVTSQSALVVDQKSRDVLYAKDMHAPRPIASISKLMTALVFLDQEPDLTSTFTLNRSDIAGAGVQYIGTGETVTLRDLLFVSLIASDNNAAQSLVRASGLEYDEFIERMNDKAQEIGMLNTNFVEPTGLQYANISSAQDVSLLLEEALKNDLIADIVPRRSYSFTAISGKEHRVFTTNKLLNSYLDVIGGKTGFNDEGQFNFTSAVRGEQNQVLLVVSLGSINRDARFQDVKAMGAWSFRNYVWEGE